VKKGEDMTLTRKPRLLTAAAVCLGVALFVGSGGMPTLARAGESSLEFVGHLISNVQHTSLDWFDPTCPQCF
jgi:hypothetical protein